MRGRPVRAVGVIASGYKSDAPSNAEYKDQFQNLYDGARNRVDGNANANTGDDISNPRPGTA
jgi:hypothetical protein